MITLTDTPFDPAKSLKDFTLMAEGAGAVVSFTGLVRPASEAGTMHTLHLQAYSPMTETGIETAISKAAARWPLTAHRIIHRIGNMSPGEAIVFVATAATHRRAAFQAADYLMDYLKTEAVFWKKEISSDGEIWIEPRAEDYSDTARWAT